MTSKSFVLYNKVYQQRKEREQMEEKDRKQYIEDWQRENIRRVVVKLNKTKDADIIEKIDRQDNVQGYIKRLIREDMQ